MPSLEWSFSLVNRTDQSRFSDAGSTANPWFWVVIKQRPVSAWVHGWFSPRLPYLATQTSPNIRYYTIHIHQQHSYTSWHTWARHRKLILSNGQAKSFPGYIQILKYAQQTKLTAIWLASHYFSAFHFSKIIKINVILPKGRERDTDFILYVEAPAANDSSWCPKQIPNKGFAGSRARISRSCSTVFMHISGFPGPLLTNNPSKSTSKSTSYQYLLSVFLTGPNTPCQVRFLERLLKMKLLDATF